MVLVKNVMKIWFLMKPELYINPFAISGILRPDHYYTIILPHQNSFLQL